MGSKILTTLKVIGIYNLVLLTLCVIGFFYPWIWSLVLLDILHKN
jgi:hypothetical protein